MRRSLLLLALTVVSPFLLSPALASNGAAADSAEAFNPKPAADDVLIPLPCGGEMALRKIYTANAAKLQDKSFMAGSTQGEALIAQAPNHRYIQGSFHDAEGYYYLIGKYELTTYQAQLLKSGGKCPKSRKLTVKDRMAQGNLSWFDAVELTKNLSAFLASPEAQKAVALSRSEAEHHKAVEELNKFQDLIDNDPRYANREALKEEVEGLLRETEAILK